MAPDPRGVDLAVIPGFVAHEAMELDLVGRAVARRGARLREPLPRDLGLVGGRENLAQAMILRLLVPQGSLTELGHAAYGSQLHRLVGKRKTEALRNLCRVYVLEVVAQEPRVESKATELTFDRDAETGSSFVFTLAVRSRPDGELASISLEVDL